MTTLIGTVGAAIILIFFVLAQTHKTSVDTLWFDAGNLLGSLLLIIYAYLLGSVPFFVLNCVWAAFSLRDVIVGVMKR